MTKKNLARIIKSHNLGRVNIAQANEEIERVLSSIQIELKRSGCVELRGFGTFEVLERKAKKARNPKTGDVVMVPARLGIRFRPSSEMLKHV